MKVLPMSVTVSIVSHGHGSMVVCLVNQLLECAEVDEVVVTCNVPEVLDIPISNRVKTVYNPSPKGFGANHNTAFEQCTTPWFLVLNPDVEFLENPFPALLFAASSVDVGVVSPKALNAVRLPEDCWRRFPTLRGLVRKAFGLQDERYFHPHDQEPPFEVQWVSGLCMLFRTEAYAALRGFDERYFLYYEDVDICARAWLTGLRVLACPGATVVHNAQRASRRSLTHMRWHATSMARYLWSYTGRIPKVCPP
jgi:N-acetylglucosaminyl-diphospho-decaprenol L-rhamnosyltransferase